ncbi:MAG: glycosyltransferase WbuB [Acetobacterium sp. MES1]|uniref:glycosyltransferase family 4 protein n=1 Tax=Acetobacterium sp. MES1 TaxID=1899015 RepID=UPI000B9D04FA|nr:glycosyltransferase family 4 protein [Acetobacterium sp. MES1]OXS25482.1 MAG: glycosyltransferase WbuB [Acetobacterium sp. MES1]
MKKTVWIWNHYATNMYKDRAGRHYSFAHYLLKQGYNPIIFCASTDHFSNENIEVMNKRYRVDTIDGITFVIIKTPDYAGNAKKRLVNMLTFYKNLFPVAKEYARINGKPDLILASSVHPLTLIAGIQIAKKFKISCICEVRDLWPESIVAYSGLKRTSLVAKILYRGEKWIYKRANKLIFTMEGGSDYIIERGWNKEQGGTIDLKKVYHINNGVDLDVFKENQTVYKFEDLDLDNEKTFKVIYTGSIRLVNNVKSIVEAAQVVKKESPNAIIFLIYGDGSDRKNLEDFCKENNINNVVFKGYVNKNRIPYVLSKSNLNIIHFEDNQIKKYGASLNKLFEYFASGKPTVSDCEFGYDLIKRYNCGMVVDQADPEQLAQAIIEFSNMPKKQYEEYCKNALAAAYDYDYQRLTEKLIELI